MLDPRCLIVFEDFYHIIWNIFSKEDWDFYDCLVFPRKSDSVFLEGEIWMVRLNISWLIKFN